MLQVMLIDAISSVCAPLHELEAKEEKEKKPYHVGDHIEADVKLR